MCIMLVPKSNHSLLVGDREGHTEKVMWWWSYRLEWYSYRPGNTEARQASSLDPSEEARPCQYLHFGLLPSRTERINFCCIIKPPKLYGSPSKLMYRLFIDGIYSPLTHLHVAWSEAMAQIVFHRLSTFQRVASSGNRMAASLWPSGNRCVWGIGPGAEGLEPAKKRVGGWRGSMSVRGEGRREAAGRSQPGEGAQRTRGTDGEEKAPCPSPQWLRRHLPGTKRVLG